MNSYPQALPGATYADVWADIDSIEPAALEQLQNVARLPWVERLAVMPDVHFGKGATVGSVIGMRDAVSPSAVGVDIGCGMAAVRTSLHLGDLPDDLHQLRLAIEAAVPVGFHSYEHSAGVVDTGLNHRRDRMVATFDDLRAPSVADRRSRALSQCGTLGGGNHFIELVNDYLGNIWVMLHSGSRNIGKELAERHISTAKGLDHNLTLPDRDLAVFLRGTPEMEAYLHDLYWAQDYALLNRDIMLHRVTAALAPFFPEDTDWAVETIKCHHNYVSEEHYDGVDLIVTRKGAISAQEGQLGLIPGSMGTGSFVVSGLGNTRGLCSASHGAGRRMSRNQARKTFTEADLVAQTAGVECRKDIEVVDEIPGAYKDLEDVIRIESQGASPLVKVEARLRTLLCVKG